MAHRLIIKNRGMIEIDNTQIKYYLGKGDNLTPSKDIYHKYKIDIPTKEQKFCYIGNEKYLIIYPIPEKKISIIISNGKKYKSTIYFLDDIKNIISGLSIVNPCFFEEGKYNTFENEEDYIPLLFGEDVNEIKDLEIKEIDFSSLRKIIMNLKSKNQ